MRIIILCNINMIVNQCQRIKCSYFINVGFGQEKHKVQIQKVEKLSIIIFFFKWTLYTE